MLTSITNELEREANFPLFFPHFFHLRRMYHFPPLFPVFLVSIPMNISFSPSLSHLSFSWPAKKSADSTTGVEKGEALLCMTSGFLLAVFKILSLSFDSFIIMCLSVTLFKFNLFGVLSDQIRSVAELCPTLCDPMNRSTPGLPVHHQLLEFTETHVHQVSDAIQPSHPLSSPSPPAPSPSQHQSLLQ